MTVEAAVEAVKLGAYDFMLKPYSMDELLITIQRAVEKRQSELKYHPKDRKRNNLPMY